MGINHARREADAFFQLVFGLFAFCGIIILAYFALIVAAIAAGTALIVGAVILTRRLIRRSQKKQTAARFALVEAERRASGTSRPSWYRPGTLLPPDIDDRPGRHTPQELQGLTAKPMPAPLDVRHLTVEDLDRRLTHLPTHRPE